MPVLPAAPHCQVWEWTTCRSILNATSSLTYLYFAAGQRTKIRPSPLILDRKVAGGLRAAKPDWTIPANGWSADTYGRYLDYADELAAVHRVSPGAVELALFRTPA